jgi:hypothetical protein
MRASFEESLLAEAQILRGRPDVNSQPAGHRLHDSRFARLALESGGVATLVLSR